MLKLCPTVHTYAFVVDPIRYANFKDPPSLSIYVYPGYRNYIYHIVTIRRKDVPLKITLIREQFIRFTFSYIYIHRYDTYTTVLTKGNATSRSKALSFKPI